VEDFLKANYSDETIKKSPHLGEVDKVTFHIDGLNFLQIMMIFFPKGTVDLIFY
jgi:hypothetical protein